MPAPKPTREENAAALVDAGLVHLHGHLGWVESQTGSGEVYEVNLAFGTCTCPDARFRSSRCKHQLACQMISDSQTQEMCRADPVA